MWKEFKEFISKGNVIDLAVGVIIGAAFGGIVKSLVEDIVTPILALLIGSVDFKGLHLVLRHAANPDNDVTLNYGNFLQVVFNFLIIAAAIFLLIKAINSFRRKKEAEPVAPAAPPEDVILLREIRDLLKEKR